MQLAVCVCVCGVTACCRKETAQPSADFHLLLPFDGRVVISVDVSVSVVLSSIHFVILSEGGKLHCCSAIDSQSNHSYFHFNGERQAQRAVGVQLNSH